MGRSARIFGRGGVAVLFSVAVLLCSGGEAAAAQRYRSFCGICNIQQPCGRANQATCTTGPECDSGFAKWDIPNQTIECSLCGPDEVVTHGCYDLANPPTCELCGGQSEPPCPTGTSCTPGCAPGLTPNTNNLCAPCGGAGQIICEDGDPTCDEGVFQAGDHCYAPGCGDAGQVLCPNGACHNGIEPQGPICVDCGGNHEPECLFGSACRHGARAIGPNQDGFRACALCGGADDILACEEGVCDGGYSHSSTSVLSAPISTCPALAGSAEQTHYLNQNGICWPGTPAAMTRAAPESWPASEPPAAGRGTVLLIHGRGSDCGGTMPNVLDDGGLYPLGHRAYCVEYAQEAVPGVDRRLVSVYAVADDLAGTPQACVATGSCTFDRTRPVAAILAPTFDVAGVAATVAQALLAIPAEGEITLVGHSQGGFIARQLVYAHYDALRWGGRKIARVVTLGHPYYAKHLDPHLYTPWLCATKDNFDCATGKWLWGWDLNVLSTPDSIDDSDYPQIEWTAVSGDGPPGNTSPEDVDGDGDADAADDNCLIFGGIPRSAFTGDTSVPIESSLGYDEGDFFLRGALQFDRRYHADCTHTASCHFEAAIVDPPVCTAGGGSPPPPLGDCWGTEPDPSVLPASGDAPRPPDAFQFDGGDRLVLAEPAAAAFDLGSTLTIEAWVRPDFGAPAGVVLNKEGEYRLGLRPSGGTSVIAWALANGTPGFVWTLTPYAPPAHKWTHVALTYDGATVRVYADGVQVQSVAGSGSVGDTVPASNDLMIGGRPGGLDGFRGHIDDVRIWSRALARSEILAGLGGNPGNGNLTGLLGWWPFDEADGDLVADAGPGGFDLSRTAMGAGAAPARQAGRGDRRGGALYFDGVDDFAAVSEPSALAALDMDGALTIEAWIFPRGGGSPTTGGVILNKEGEYALVRWGDGRITWSLANTIPGWVSTQSTFVAPAHAWTHVALVYDDAINRVRLYVNGALHQEWSANGTIGDFHPTQNELRIGGRMQSAQQFHGVIDQVRLWNVARTEAQIAADFDRVLPDPASAEGLVAAWRFDEERGGVAFDAAGGHHATLGNAAPLPRPGRALAPQLPGYALRDPAACGNGLFDPLEACDDGGTNGGDGCSAACRSEETFLLRGAAQGGSISLVVDGETIQIFTMPGQSIADILAALAAAINGDPDLAARGVLATAVGGLLWIGGPYSGVVIADPGLSDCSTGPETPSIAGPAANTCPDTTVALAAPAAAGWQWRFDDQPIAGAADQTYAATLSGNYSVVVRDAFGCEAVSSEMPVTVGFCPASEASPRGAIFPLRIENSAASPTGRYLYFQKVDGADGYHLYSGLAGNYYSHGASLDNVCGLAACGIPGGTGCYDDLGTGELRIALPDDAGDRYYYVSAYALGVEGPVGLDSTGAAIDPASSSCNP